MCTYEFLGKALLLLSLNIFHPDFSAIDVCIMVFAIIVIFGPVSGAHINPAISTAVLVREGCQNLYANIVFWIFIVFS